MLPRAHASAGSREYGRRRGSRPRTSQAAQGSVAVSMVRSSGGLVSYVPGWARSGRTPFRQSLFAIGVIVAASVDAEGARPRECTDPLMCRVAPRGRGWHHHVSVALACFAFVVAERARAFPPSGGSTRPAGPKPSTAGTALPGFLHHRASRLASSCPRWQQGWPQAFYRHGPAQ